MILNKKNKLTFKQTGYSITKLPNYYLQTWQDLRSKAKKRQEIEGMFPPSLVMLTQAEQDALGLKNVSSSSNTNSQENTEFVQLEQSNEEENFHLEMEAISEPESPPETKVFTQKKIKNNSQTKYKHSSKHSNNCVFNCDLLAVHERRKVELKEEYINFKKNYLRQKLKLMKEQTEALKVIAKELSDK